jgi:hypothetical protein
MFGDVGLITTLGGNLIAAVIFVAEGRQLMVTQHRSIARKLVTTVALTGGAAAIATGMALAGAGTAAAENQHNVVTQNGNKFTPGSTVAARSSVAAQSSVGDAGTNFLTQVGTAISNAQIQVGTAGTNAISQTGTAIQNGQVQVGTAGNNAISQLGTAGFGLLNGIGNLFNRG